MRRKIIGIFFYTPLFLFQRDFFRNGIISKIGICGRNFNRRSERYVIEGCRKCDIWIHCHFQRYSNQSKWQYVCTSYLIFRNFFQIGRRYSLLLSCTGSVLCIELASGSFLLKDFIKDPVIGMICDYSLLITIPAFMFFLGMGITPVPWILLGEWFVSETRSFIGGIGSATFFLSALISLQVGIFFLLFCSEF